MASMDFRQVTRSLLIAGAVVFAIGCAKRPAEMKREARLDELCEDQPSTVAYTYPTNSPEDTKVKLPEDAVSAGCESTIQSWTDKIDIKKGGARKIAYDLRENDGLTFLCCPKG